MRNDAEARRVGMKARLKGEMKPYYEEAGITIYHGDCREILPTLKGDLLLTDPPYGVGLEYDNGVDDSLDAAKRLYFDFLSIAENVVPIALTTVGCFELEKYLYATLPPRWRLCWRKGITSRPSPVGFTDWEPVFVYGTKVHRHAHDLFTAQPERMGSFGHPCPKPIKFALWLIARFADEGATVIDPFMGSGTTLRAAKDLGRKAIGIEIEEKYCEIAAKRLAQQVLPLTASSLSEVVTGA
jgi:site-specific DNA-methyltransferase (adenine-specific)